MGRPTLAPLGGDRKGRVAAGELGKR